VTVLTHYLGWEVGLAQPETQTTEAERECLARYASGRRRLVEIGVWHGVTTSRLRAAMAPDGVLSAVDPFPRGRLGFSAQRRIAHQEVAKITNGHVRWLRTNGHHASTGHGPVDFVFMDGDHSEQALRADWGAWSGLVESGGIVAIHDSRSTAAHCIEEAGSVQVTRSLIAKDDRFDVVDVVDSLTVLKRRESPAVIPARRLKVLFFVEGFTDIRFVVGLSEICDLTMAVPSRAYHESGLKHRVQESGARVQVHEIAGGRLAFQARSLSFLWRAAPRFDVILSQEVLRGSLNATVVGALRHVPVVTYMGISPVEYFRCRRERRQIGFVAALAGETVIRALMAINGRLASRCLAMGPYLRGVAARSCPRSEVGLYYGVDVDQFRPADAQERAALRRRLDLPPDKFLVVLSSRISHEKDPDTVIRAAARARAAGLDLVLLNLGGGYRQFLDLARAVGPDDVSQWVLGRPAVHPMHELADYLRAADAVAQASLAEGLGLAPLEALACETPIVVTAVGGMAGHLQGYAQLTPRRDADAMAEALLTIARRPEMARAQARLGREYVRREWSRAKAFRDLARILEEAADQQ
jgi:glycosyltransferase involved in cell wall biosynthesis